MDNEKQKSFDNDIDAALNIVREDDSVLPDAKVYQFPERADNAEAETVTADVAETAVASSTPEKRSKVREALSLGLIATVAVLAAPRPGFMTESPEPPKSPTTLLEGAEQAPQTPFNPETDKAIIKIRVKQNDTEKNSPSEAVLNDNRVIEYMNKHPEESSSLETSANSLPGSAEKIVITSRDVDGDGDKDTVAVPVDVSDE